MKKLLEKFSLSTGFTKTEISTLFFVILIFIFGLLIKWTKVDFSQEPIEKFDYSYQDSLFKALSNKENIKALSSKKNEKRVDSEVELSDFSRQNLDSKKKTNSQLKESSININTASEKALTKLPGIGKTIARRIVKLRTQKGGFKNLDELIEVKRIGLKKLNSIKKFIYIEK